LISKLKSIFFC